jgi:hypothetical protein
MATTTPAAPGSLTVSSRMKTVYSVAIFLGVIVLAATMVRDSGRAWHSFVTSYFFFTSLALGGLFFASFNHVVKAGWSVNVRRIAEAFTAALPFVALGAIALFVGGPKLYSWMRPADVANDPLLQHKAGYLNATFFAIRLVVFVALWLWFAKVMVGRSLSQDKTRNDALTVKQTGTGIAFLLVFALSYTFFSIDALMSLAPHWFSTIFGVYCFAGLFQSTMAAVILFTLYLMKKGKLTGFVNENHLHDLGKFMFAFTVFWAYIAFSQYMLIWYANLPEETFFFMPRMEPGWVWVSIALLLFKFVVPFVALLSRWAKRSHGHLAAVSVLILVMQYVDFYWLVYPNFNEERAVFGLPEIGGIALFFGLFLFAVTRFLSRNQVVPIGDPRIEESLHHVVTY